MDTLSVEIVQQRIAYEFSDPHVLAQALTHASVANHRLESNERMEFLGDAVLGLVVCDELFRRCEYMLEGGMTRIKSSVVSRETCADVTEQLDILDQAKLGKGMSRRGRLPRSIAAALYEAVVGAIYVDGGFEPAKRFVLATMAPHIERALANQHRRNYKSMLQQYAQQNHSATPMYTVLDEKGPDHSKCFEVAAVIDGRTFPSAWGTNKKSAEQLAAERALLELEVLTPDQEPDQTPDLPDTDE